MASMGTNGAKRNSVVSGRGGGLFLGGTLCVAAGLATLAQASTPSPITFHTPVTKRPAANSSTTTTTTATVDLRQLTVTATGTDSAFVETGAGLRAGQLSLSAFGQYERTAPIGAAVDGSRTTTHLAGGLGLSDALTVGVALPVVVTQSSTVRATPGLDLQGQPVDPARTAPGATFAAPVFEARVTVLRQENGFPVDLGGSLSVGLPLGGAQVSLLPRLGVGRAFGEAVRVGVEAGAELPTNGTTAAVSVAANALTLGQGVRAELAVRGLVATVDGAASGEVLVGARTPLGSHALELMTMVGAGLATTSTTPSLNVVVGLAWSPGGHAAARATVLAAETSVEPTVMVGCISDTAAAEVFSEEHVLDDAVHFELAQATVSDEDLLKLTRVATLLKAHPSLTVALHGHADTTGSAEFNATLSLARAQAVEGALVAQGVDASRLTVHGHGAAAPLVDNDAQGRALNRRVEFVIAGR
jgi:outer membrane protein OmpA-like peptidoglycan-associated protein